MIRIFEYQRKPKRLADRVPWFGVVADAPCVVRHKDGSLQHTLRMQPLDLNAATAYELRAHAARLNNVFKRFGGGWAGFVEHAKRRVRHYPQASWPNAVCAAADAEREQYFLNTPHYTLESLVTPVWQPQRVMEQKLGRLFLTGQRGTAQEDAIQTFQDQVLRFTDLLTGCSAWTEPLGPEQMLTYLHSTVSTSCHPVTVPDIPAWLDYYLTDREFVPGHEPALLIEAKPRPQGTHWQDRYRAWHLRTLTISGWPNATYPEMLLGLAALPFEYRFMARSLYLDQGDAYKIMRHKRGLFAQGKLTLKQHLAKYFQTSGEPPRPDPGAQAKEDTLEEAMNDSASGIVSHGYYTATVTVWDEDPAVANEKRREVEKVITGIGFTCHLEHLNATEAWLSSLPGHCYANVRQPLVNSLNMVHCLMGGVYTGPARDEQLQAPALLMVDTEGNIPYNIVLHENGLGHTLIVGPSGSGKTVLVGTLAMAFQRYHALGAQVRLMDKKEGLKPVTRAMDGDHYTLGGVPGGLAFQPLRGIDDLLERQWGASWVEHLCAVQQVPCTPAQRRELGDALKLLAGLAPDQRTLTGLLHLVQDHGIRRALHPYTAGELYGHVLDAVAEPLTLRNWTCFETDTLFTTPPLIAPVQDVLFHQLGQTFGQKLPTFFAMDEAWKYLQVFQAQIEEYLRELRKLNVSIIFSTQDLNELLASPISTVIRNNCPIQFLLPNKRATEGLVDGKAREGSIAAAYKAIGLNDRQLDMLSMAIPQKEYMILTKDGCRMVDLALGPVQQTILTEGRLP